MQYFYYDLFTNHCFMKYVLWDCNTILIKVNNDCAKINKIAIFRIYIHCAFGTNKICKHWSRTKVCIFNYQHFIDKWNFHYLFYFIYVYIKTFSYYLLGCFLCLSFIKVFIKMQLSLMCRRRFVRKNNGDTIFFCQPNHVIFIF